MTEEERRGIIALFETTMMHHSAVQPNVHSPVITAAAVWRKAGFVCLRHTGFGTALSMCRAKPAGHGLRGGSS